MAGGSVVGTAAWVAAVSIVLMILSPGSSGLLFSFGPSWDLGSWAGDEEFGVGSILSLDVVGERVASLLGETSSVLELILSGASCCFEDDPSAECPLGFPREGRLCLARPAG